MVDLGVFVLWALLAGFLVGAVFYRTAHWKQVEADLQEAEADLQQSLRHGQQLIKDLDYMRRALASERSRVAGA